MVIFTLFIVIGLSFSILLLIKVLWQSDYKYLYYLSTLSLLFLVCLELFYGLLFISKHILTAPYLIRINTPFVFVIGPAIYFFVYSRVNPKSSWKRQYLLHLIPFLLVGLYFIPLYLSPIEEKIAYVQNLYISLSNDSVVIGGLRRIQQSIYLIFAARYFFQNFQRFKLNNVQYSAGVILGLFTIILLLDLYRYFFQFDLLSGVIDSILLSGIAIFLVYAHLMAPGKLKSGIQESSFLIMASCEEKILNVLEKEKVYLNPKLNLRVLAQSIDCSSHLVSMTINQKMKLNFNKLVNTYRVEEAKRLLQAPEYSHLTIEAIAELAGFNSVSSFNDNFKKLTAKPPKEYRK